MYFNQSTLTSLAEFKSNLQGVLDELEQDIRSKVPEISTNKSKSEVDYTDKASFVINDNKSNCTDLSQVESELNKSVIDRFSFSNEIIDMAYTSNAEDALIKASKYFKPLNGITYVSYVRAVNAILTNMALSRTPFIPSEEQLRVLYSMSNRLLVESGAGTGKTTTIVIKMFIEQNIFKLNASDILAITYTESGASSMQDKYSQITKTFKGNRYLTFTTIHSYCAKLVRAFTDTVNVITETSPVVSCEYDFEEQEYIDKTVYITDLIQEGIDMLGLQYKPSAKSVLTALATISEKCITSEEEYRDMESYIDFQLSYDQLMQVRSHYETKKEELHAMDFMNMLEKAYEILTDVYTETIVPITQQQRELVYFKSIYVDEFQDISPLQMEILRQLLKINKDVRLTCIGDADQSIYSFRGASVDFILNFPDEFKNNDLDIIFLTRNRRSVKNIIDFSGNFIGYNKKRYPKHIRGLDNDDRTGKIKLLLDSNLSMLSKGIIVKAIQKQLSEDMHKLRNIAVLYREHKQSIWLINYLLVNRIPFHVNLDSKSNLFLPNSEEVRDLTNITYLLNSPGSADSIQQSLYKIVPKMSKEDAKNIAMEIKKQPSKKLLSFLKIRTEWSSAIPVMITLKNLLNSEDTTPEEFYTILIQQYKKSYYDNLISRSKTRIDMSQYLLDYYKSKKSLSTVPQEIAEDALWLITGAHNVSGINLMTFHASKGLEYRQVFILPIGDDVSPKKHQALRMSKRGAKEYIEEERRLLYVAITRAIEELTIFYTDKSHLFPKQLLMCLADMNILEESTTI